LKPRLQEKELKPYAPNLPPNTILSCIDFFKNEKWDPRDALVFISNYHPGAYHISNQRRLWCSNPKSKILKEVHYYVLDEKEHDILFVQHDFMLNWGFV
jgi:hypothetical protein